VTGTASVSKEVGSKADRSANVILVVNRACLVERDCKEMCGYLAESVM